MNIILNAPDENFWGYQISWFDWNKRRIYGHLSPLPKEGDTFTYAMKSGKRALFKIIKVEPCGNPPDMFWADVEDVKYIEESNQC